MKMKNFSTPSTELRDGAEEQTQVRTLKPETAQK